MGRFFKTPKYEYNRKTMNYSQARFAAICSCLMFLFALGTGFCWWKVIAMDHEALGVAPVSLKELMPVRLPTQLENNETVGATVTSTNNTSAIESPEEPRETSTDSQVIVPKQLTLAVPFTSQAPEKKWDQPWQDACEEAAALMIDAYYKKYKLSVMFARDEIIKMVAWEEGQGWERSIEVEKIQIIFEQYLGLAPKKKVRLIENPTVEQLKRLIAQGKPIYAVADGKVLPNPHFRSGGPEYHALIIKGYNETEFITNDPGTQFGEGLKYQYEDVMMSLRDWNGGDVKDGRRVVLVIE